jgi:hypothetical protein
MARFYTELNEQLHRFIAEQHLFFVASAPHEGRINLSPKGMHTLRTIDDYTVAYLDLTGSGNETAAHISDDGRVTLMMCSFDEAPLILRIYGQGSVVHTWQPEWDQWARRFELLPGARQIIVVRIESVQTSCGFAVPRFEFVEERPKLCDWAASKGEEGLDFYRQEKNLQSIDGLPTNLRPSTP